VHTDFPTENWVSLCFPANPRAVLPHLIGHARGGYVLVALVNTRTTVCSLYFHHFFRRSYRRCSTIVRTDFSRSFRAAAAHYRDNSAEK
jgi:hypothetical protein